MYLSTTDNVFNFRIRESLGLVKGSTVRSRNIGSDILAGFKNLIGGEIVSYTKLIKEARDEALNRMIQDTEEKGADAIVGIRFETSSIMQGASEIFVYGTAVKLNNIL